MKLTFKTITALLCSSFLSACTLNNQQLSVTPAVQDDKPKNVILFIGDGMGISTVTAIRILDGQLKGGYGEENILAWEKFPNVALSKTYNTNQQVPDSAGTATAFMTGVKTKAGFINVRDKSTRGDCASSIGNNITSALEIAENMGLSTGVVTTARFDH